ncbi:MAG: sigma-70 family RNA polymerase sigma factor [Sphingobacteriaceae bacterium]|nr:sigma-70 family RNA polymerase sigma factor [Sphingobacteriaceae bacterium]MBK7817211.1 sigma-70 family RNA polymerase sigma factor [Sphingobacteriaceae bacterium]
MRQLKITKSITNRDAASLDKYLADISRLELITAEEEVRLARLIREGDEAALEKLTKANLRFVVSVAKQYQNQGISLPDLINEGNVGLIKAAKRFDETRGFKFISYAVWWIRQSIMQAVSEQSRMIRLPLNKIGALNRIKRAQSVLEQKYQRTASLFELSEVLDMSQDEIQVTLAASALHVSSDASLPGNEESTLMELIYDKNEVKPDDLLMESSLQTEIKRALNTLSDKEKDVILLFFGIGQQYPHTLEEIAEKYDLTRERVRQIKEKGIRRLRMESKSKLLKTYLG